MRPSLAHLDRFRKPHPRLGYGDAFNGYVHIGFRPTSIDLTVIFSNGLGWDHVSVSARRCPNWQEMHFVKGLFFTDEEVVVQYHPKAAEYRSLHPTCLHMWRWQGGEFPRPHPSQIAVPGSVEENERVMAEILALTG